MIRTGKVIANNNGNCEIEFVRLEACGKCRGCNLNNTPARLTMPGNYNVGDFVDVSLPNEQFLKATAVAYLIPLIGLLVGLVLGSVIPKYFDMKTSDVTTLIGGVSGLALSMLGLGVSERLRKKPAAWEPFIVGKVVDPSCTGVPAFTMDSIRINKGE
ncbi:MAG: SoxR reducing system RseC family protein [Christensenellaceae bacterium]|nr:SoxR reducing system RseC family protein [Christensenellaceae bacterium]